MTPSWVIRRAVSQNLTDLPSTSETTVNFHQTTRRNIPEGFHLHTRRRQNLKPHHGHSASPSLTALFHQFDFILVGQVRISIWPTGVRLGKQCLVHIILSWKPLCLPLGFLQLPSPPFFSYKEVQLLCQSILEMKFVRWISLFTRELLQQQQE
jgi:hypothetical protein